MRGRKRKKENEDSGISTLYERSKYSLDLVNSWICNADTKVEISCAIMTFVIGAITFIAGNVLFNMELHVAEKCCYEVLFYLICIAVGLCFLSSLWFHIWAIMPNLPSASKCDGEKANALLFYGDISNVRKDNFIGQFKCTSENEFIDEILNETYINSRICNKKMHRFKVGIILAFICIVLTLAACICFYLVYIR